MSSIARARCPIDKTHYLDNTGRPTYEVLGFVAINGVIKAVARHKKHDHKFLLAMSASNRTELTGLLPTTYQNAKVCGLNAQRCLPHAPLACCADLPQTYRR